MSLTSKPINYEYMKSHSSLLRCASEGNSVQALNCFEEKPEFYS